MMFIQFFDVQICYFIRIIVLTTIIKLDGVLLYSCNILIPIFIWSKVDFENLFSLNMELTFH